MRLIAPVQVYPAPMAEPVTGARAGKPKQKNDDDRDQTTQSNASHEPVSSGLSRLRLIRLGLINRWGLRRRCAEGCSAICTELCGIGVRQSTIRAIHSHAQCTRSRKLCAMNGRCHWQSASVRVSGSIPIHVPVLKDSRSCRRRDTLPDLR